MDAIFITNLRARSIIGINDWEREKRQEIVINITLYADTSQAGATDDLNESVNYRTIAKKVLSYAEHSERYTLEALAHDFATICLQDPLVEKVRVRVEKPGAVRFSDSVGIEIERSLHEV
jgi:FolB domain-containing protein